VVGVSDLDDAFAAGVSLAERRLRRYGIDPPIERISGTLNEAQRLLNVQPGAVASRAVELWSETVAIAASDRGPHTAAAGDVCFRWMVDAGAVAAVLGWVAAGRGSGPADVTVPCGCSTAAQ